MYLIYMTKNLSTNTKYKKHNTYELLIYCLLGLREHEWVPMLCIMCSIWTVKLQKEIIRRFPAILYPSG